jgi:hypothetical protein
MTRSDSWWLKVERAKKHLVELKDEMRRYSERHPYEAVRARKTKRNPHAWQFRLRLTEQPDPAWAVIIGDILYDLRSALDHLAVAVAPARRKFQAGFPVAARNIWERDATRAYVIRDPNPRRSFKSAIEGMPIEAIAFIKSVQPYNAPVDQVETHFLRIISRLENADKHRNLVLLGSGVKNGTLVVSINEDVRVIPMGPGIVEDGAPLVDSNWGASGPLRQLLTNPKVNVQVAGTATVALKIVRDGGHNIFELPESLDQLVGNVESKIIPGLEPFVRP